MELLENLLIPTMKKSSSRQFSFVKRFGKNTLTTLTLSAQIPNKEKKLNSISMILNILFNTQKFQKN